MLNLLKYDFYRLKNSMSLRFVYVLSVILTVALFVFDFSPSKKNLGMFMFLDAFDYRSLYCLTIIFVGFFVGGDFSSGYIKNIYPVTNKFYYVLSKLIYLVCYVVCIYALTFISGFVLVFIFGSKCFCTENEKIILEGLVGKSLLSFVFKLTACVSVGAVTMLLVSLIKNNYFVIGGECCYVYLLSRSLVWNLNEFLDVSLEYYLPFGSNVIMAASIPKNAIYSATAFVFITCVFTELSLIAIKNEKI